MAEENKIKVTICLKIKKSKPKKPSCPLSTTKKNAAATAKAAAAAHAAANLPDKASRPSEKSYFSDGLFLSKHLQVNQ